MFILDSFALLCLFDKKRPKARQTIVHYLERSEREEIRLYLSKINEGEIFYKLYKYLSESIARGFREDLRNGVIPVQVVPVNDKRVERASEIKANYPVSYADAFCIELARDRTLPVITGDPEFEAVTNIVDVVWMDKKA
jgi:predicted nucleic acid-binding protein